MVVLVPDTMVVDTGAMCSWYIGIGVEAIVAADIVCTGLVVVALLSPLQHESLHSQLNVSMEYNAIHACQ